MNTLHGVTRRQANHLPASVRRDDNAKAKCVNKLCRDALSDGIWASLHRGRNGIDP